VAELGDMPFGRYEHVIKIVVAMNKKRERDGS